MENFIEALEAIEELKEKSEEGWVIVVEGIRDVISLRKLGVSGEIITFSGFTETAEKVYDRQVIILTDYDKGGFKIEKGLYKSLLAYGNVPDIELKRRIFCKIKKFVTKVEELYTFLGDIYEC